MGRAGVVDLRHRGPGGSGEWVDEAAGVFLGHTRLATFDPTPASHQPMERDGSCLAFNGELFNFRELRSTLEDTGIGFSSRGDTEVLLRAWQVWQSRSLDRFDGPFAIALWDGSEAHLAVDPFGEKFLFAAEMPDGVYISSELGPLARHLNLRAELGGDALVAYFAFGYIPSPKTAYPQIQRLSAATHVTIRNGAVVDRRRYWKMPEGEPGRGRPVPLTEGDLDQLQDALAVSLAPRLRCDVPLCMLLSSGVDSTLLTAVARREFDVRLDCVTATFEGEGAVDEGRAAQAIANHLDVPHRIVKGQLNSETATFDLLLDLYGQPVAGTGIFALLEVSATVAQDYQVALTGSGGDEIFMGFGKNADLYRLRRIYALPEILRLAVGAVARGFAGRSGILARLAYEVGVHDWERYLANRNYPAIRWLRRLDGFEPWARGTFGRDTRPLEISVPAFDRNCVMPDARFVAVDVGSMRASVATRNVFTHRHIVETVARFDPRAFFAFGQKSVLRRLLARYLPDTLIDRRKIGFVFPGAEFESDFPALPPTIPGLDPADIEAVWHRREEGAGWAALGLRLALAERFLRQAQ